MKETHFRTFFKKKTEKFLPIVSHKLTLPDYFFKSKLSLKNS